MGIVSWKLYILKNISGLCYNACQQLQVFGDMIPGGTENEA